MPAQYLYCSFLWHIYDFSDELLPKPFIQQILFAIVVFPIAFGQKRTEKTHTLTTISLLIAQHCLPVKDYLFIYYFLSSRNPSMLDRSETVAMESLYDIGSSSTLRCARTRNQCLLCSHRMDNMDQK